MLKNIFTTILLIFISAQLFSQTNFSNDPDSSAFVTSDINNFWKVFDEFKKDTLVNLFGKEYIDIGSAGLKAFIPNRITSAEHLFKVVKLERSNYEKIRTNSLHIKDKEKQCRSIFYALKYCYPEAHYPVVYFVIGAFNSGGTSTDAGLIIGAEKQTDINNIPYIVAHELIHFQQKDTPDKPTLLQQSIIEGSADFLGELISGVNTNKKAMDYGNEHKENLCKEFVSRMDGSLFNDWLYSVTGKDDRPHDLGYWIGYKIVEKYFKNSTDKRQAIKDILDIKDYKDFLNESGYLKQYLN